MVLSSVQSAVLVMMWHGVLGAMRPVAGHGVGQGDGRGADRGAGFRVGPNVGVVQFGGPIYKLYSSISQGSDLHDSVFTPFLGRKTPTNPKRSSQDGLTPTSVTHDASSLLLSLGAQSAYLSARDFVPIKKEIPDPVESSAAAAQHHLLNFPANNNNNNLLAENRSAAARHSL